ncbi:MAG: sulfurtransferase TusA family protein [Candidatus Thorarchaeota archaeon]|nr:MAG: sulfurtransferase TusA family protein [Candidatus Thorarchaeota archaeon]
MNDAEPTKTLDCVGLFCPMPLLQARKSIDTVEVGEILELLADDPGAESDIKRFCKRTGHELVSYEKFDDGVQRFLIRRLK